MESGQNGIMKNIWMTLVFFVLTKDGEVVYKDDYEED